MAACPTCGGVTSSGSECARCRRRESKAGPVALDDADGPPSALPELDLPPPPAIVSDVAAEAPAVAPEPPRDSATGAREGAPSPRVQLSLEAGKLLAGFGPAPENPFAAVPYALRVHARLASLRAEREAARRDKPHEVPLYDVALTAYDESGYTVGLAVLGSTVVVAVLLVVAPILLAILRSV